MSRTADRSAQGEALSRAVWSVLAGQGLERLTVRAVATAAGCTTGLVMHRFPNRQALLLHARQLLHEMTRARVEALEAEAATPRVALRAVLHQGMALDEQTRQEAIVWMGFLAAAVADDQLIEEHRRNNRAWRERVERLTAAAAPEWTAARVSAVALALITMAEGVAVYAAADPAAFPPADQESMLDAALVAFELADGDGEG
ncbi:TetR family transcriptional regulator [Actinoplanes italicus]|uniref:TetR family transcriptional regulator n=1 Tax=Actinoplanes italicus TaxID=113567 RepID=A0A2T0KLQ6_9ACTN|nr:TetR family transcriptional regulator C-terminal domain-containing protein [Actinoplanes italicus]PRX24552.1 TetR family transcriptional regulator [Actinoplanes italicus]GIE27722.1 TetR family transcriptional regulator [Actinoplanes italicus]